jgi:replicative DNA helicase
MAQQVSEGGQATRRRRPDGRVPPHNLQAEESLLGAMLLSRDAIAAAAEVVAADDFYKPAHGHVYDAVTSLYAAGEPADPVTVAEELSRAGLLEAIGGPAVLVSLQAGTPATTNAGRYARIVEEHALLRRLIGVAGEIAEMGYELPEDVTKTIDRAEAMVFDVAQRRVTDSMAPLRDLLSANLDRLEQLFERGQSITGVPTGYTDLDELLSGLQPSSLVVVGARPAAGKTAFALGMASHASVETDRPVLFFSLEMSQMELTQRLLAAEARVDSRGLRNGQIKKSDWPKISHAVGRLAGAPLWIDDNPNLTVMEIRAKARRLKSRVGDIGMVVVDYLQLMTGRSAAENRQVEVSEISRGLKILAREIEAPVVALSQLSRALEQRSDKRPMLADLRESGCLTADTRLARADTGEHVTLGELFERDERDVPVWTVDDQFRVVRGTLSHVFSSGVKDVFRMRLASGLEVTASANHPFLSLGGWRQLRDLGPGARVAVAREVPEPSEPTKWLDEEVIVLAHLLGGGALDGSSVRYSTPHPANADALEGAAWVFGSPIRRLQCGAATRIDLVRPRLHRRYPVGEWLERLNLRDRPAGSLFVPRSVFSLGGDQLALFLRHLWSTNGWVARQGRYVSLGFRTADHQLARDVQLLLLRFGVSARLHPLHLDVPQYLLFVHGARNQRRFLDRIGVHGLRPGYVRELQDQLAALDDGVSIDLTAVDAWSQVRRWQPLPELVHSAGDGGGVAALAVGDLPPSPPPDRPPITSAVGWEEIVSVDPLGPRPVFDGAVPGTHNFVAEGIVAHNSIEQDADVVMFIYRDELYNPDSQDRGTAEILVAKHRNGPTGMTRLAFLDHYTRFANMARGV